MGDGRVYRATVRIPEEIHQTLNAAIESTGGVMTKSGIIRRAVEEYINSGRLDKDVKTLQKESDKAYEDKHTTITTPKRDPKDLLRELNTCKYKPSGRWRIFNLTVDEIRHILTRMPEPTPENIERDLKNLKEAATIKWVAETLKISPSHARSILMGANTRRILGWYHLGWVGYMKGERGTYMYYRLKDVEEIINEAHGLLVPIKKPEKRGERRALSKKGLTLIIKEILNRGDWVTTNQVMDELISRDRRFSKMITTTLIMRRLHALARDVERKRVDGRRITRYRGLKEEWGDQG